MCREYPLSIRDVKPFPSAELLTGINPDGMPGGFHTGGAWKYGERVYKPLDGRPYANCPVHIETKEEQILTELADKAGFPQNWTVEEHNGRRFLVRNFATVASPDQPPTPKTLLLIEEGIRIANRAGWEISDCIAIGGVGIGEDKPFILDLSNAHKVGKNADDTWRVNQMFKLFNQPLIHNLRTKATGIIYDDLDLAIKYMH